MIWLRSVFCDHQTAAVRFLRLALRGGQDPPQRNPILLGGTQLGPNVFWRDPIGDPNDLKLVAVHVGGEASKPSTPAHVEQPNK